MNVKKFILFIETDLEPPELYHRRYAPLTDSRNCARQNTEEKEEEQQHEEWKEKRRKKESM